MQLPRIGLTGGKGGPGPKKKSPPRAPKWPENAPQGPPGPGGTILGHFGDQKKFKKNQKFRPASQPASRPAGGRWAGGRRAAGGWAVVPIPPPLVSTSHPLPPTPNHPFPIFPERVTVGRAFYKCKKSVFSCVFTQIVDSIDPSILVFFS